MKKDKLTKLAKIEIYFSPNLRKLFGVYETFDRKNFVVKIRKGLPLEDFVDTFYHELTHIVMDLIDRARVDTMVENLKLGKGLVRVRVKTKEEEVMCDKVSREATKIFMRFLKEHASS